MAQDMVRVKWFDSVYKLCASPDYLRNTPALRTLDDLKLHRCVLFGYPQPQSLWSIQDEQDTDHKVSVTPAIVSSTGLAQLELTIAGVGLGLMPNWLASPALESGALVEVLPECTITPTDFEGAAWLLYPNRSFLPAKTRVLVDFLLAHMPLSRTG